MLVNLLLALASIWIFGTWIAGLCALVLIFVWRLLPSDQGPPVLPLVMTTQWAQVTCGLFYAGLTGRELQAIVDSDYEPMVLVGLGSVVALTIGLALGIQLVQRNMEHRNHAPAEIVTLQTLLIVYAAAIAVTGAMQQVAFVYSQFTQAILALAFIRLGLLSLVFRRLTFPRLQGLPILAILSFEVALGFTGFFSDFKEPIVLAGLALLEVFDRKRAEHWVAGGALGAALIAAFVMWMSVRGEFRADFDDVAFASRTTRLQRMQGLATDWFRQRDVSVQSDVDNFVDRAWAIYYPALTMERVPAVLPHTDGQLMSDVLFHLVTPRLFFPDKPPLPNESEFVRRYAGADVAGEEEGTTFAFGYAAESYVDFGIPMMFLPILVFGVLMGCAYEGILRFIAHREISIGLVTCIFWINLSLFERSWSKILGLALTMMAYLGGVAFLVDRYLIFRNIRRIEEDPGLGDETSVYGGAEP